MSKSDWHILAGIFAVMSACFGLQDGWHLWYFPANRLVESRVEGRETITLIQAAPDRHIFRGRHRHRDPIGGQGYRLARHGADISVNGNRVAVVWDDQARPWFLCAACGRRCEHLYLNELACRICCGLDCACRHLHRTSPGFIAS
jgi:hypothetical protein